MRVAVGSHEAAWPGDPFPYLAGGLVFGAILFGGGGAEGPLQNGVLEALGALLFFVLAASHFAGKPLPTRAIVPVWLTVAALVVVMLQVLPVPPSLWSGLPGRETAVAVDLLVDNRLAWRSISLDPEATRRSAAALLLPLPIALVALRSSRRELLFIVRCALAGAMVSAALGSAQIALGSPEMLAPYGGPVPGVASGLFANSNHQASLMLASLVMAAALIRLDDASLKIRTGRGVWRTHLGWLLMPVFSIMVVVSMSRAGWALLPLALVGSLLIATGRRGSAGIAIMVLVALAFTISLVLTFNSTGGGNPVQGLLQDNRLISLPDIVYTLHQFWPVGSGLGTFVRVYQANENLDLVSVVYLNHAHNDVLELLIETGIVGALLLAATAVAVVRRLWKVYRGGSSAEATAAIAGAWIVALLSLHSLVDYPLRSDAIAAIAGVGLGLVFARPERDPESRRSRQSRRRPQRGFDLVSQSAVQGGR